MKRDRVPIIVSALALCVSLGSLYVTYLAYSDYHRHQRLEFTLGLLRAWDKDTLAARSTIVTLHDIYDARVCTVIPIETINTKRRDEVDAIASGRMPHGTPLVTDHIAVIMNFMEDFALARKMQLIDDTYFEASLRPSFERWHRALYRYRKTFDPEKGIVYPWPLVDEMIDDWATQSRSKIPKAPRTGAPFGSPKE